MTTLLVLQHEDECPPGMLGRWWVEDGVRLDVRRPYAGEPMPPDLVGHDGAVVPVAGWSGTVRARSSTDTSGGRA